MGPLSNPADVELTNDEIMQALADLLGSSVFQTNSRLPRLLRYIVTTEIEGRGETLKAYVIATDALGRGKDFDPTGDSIVRVEINRLRQSLTHYYATEGSDCAITIEIPKGQYRPLFRKKIRSPAQHPGSTPSIFGKAAFWLVSLTAVAVAAVAIAIFGFETDNESDLPLAADGSGPAEEELSSNPAYHPSPTGRPPFPRIYTTRFAADDLAADVILAIESAVSKFSNISVLTSEVADTSQQIWPEDYRFEVSTVSGSDITTVYLRMVHVASQELIESREVVVGAAGGAGFAASDIERLQELAADLVSRGGALEQDYRRRGSYSPTMRCELMTLDFFAQQTAAAHLAARDCAEAEIAAGNRASFLYVALALLHCEEYTDGLNRRPGDPLRRALRAANSATNRDPGSSFGYFAQMMVYSLMGDVDATMRAGEVAVSLNPLDADIMAVYGMRLSYFGRPDEALIKLKRAEQLQPSAQHWRDYAFFLSHYQLGQMEQAASRARILGGATDPHYRTAEAIGAWHDGDVDRARLLIRETEANAPEFMSDPRASYLRRHYSLPLIDRLVADIARAQGVAISEQGHAASMPDSAAEGVAQRSESARPAVPRLFVVAESSDVQAISVALAIEAAASRFSLLRVVSQPVRVPSLQEAWPEDYVVTVSVASGEERSDLLMRIVHAQSGELVDTDAFVLPLQESDVLDLLENEALQRSAADLVRRRGLIEQDYRRRGAHTETMTCVLLFSDYLDSQDPERHANAKACVEARIAAGDLEPYLRVILAVLHLENFVRGFDARSAEALDWAIGEAGIAMSLDPSSAHAYFVQAWIHALRDETEAMVRMGEQAVRLNPLDADMLAGLGMRMSFAGQYRDAVGLLERAESLQPAAQRWRHYALFIAYYGLNDMPSAAVRAQMLAGSGVPTHIAARAVAALKAGDFAGARTLVAELIATNPAYGNDPSAIYARRNYAPELVDLLVADLLAAGMASQTAH